jgi:hypothetical protein
MIRLMLRFKPMPTASLATITLNRLSGSLNSLACMHYHAKHKHSHKGQQMSRDHVSALNCETTRKTLD